MSESKAAAQHGQNAPNAPNAQNGPRSSSISADRERRQHHHLRDLIDEMMASLRAAANRDIFSPGDRAEAEAQLARIMARVHAEAIEVGDRRVADRRG